MKPRHYPVPFIFLLSVLFLQDVFSQDLIVPSNGNIFLDGTNRWILYTPDDGRSTLYIAPSNPYPDYNWNWDRTFSFLTNGNFEITGVAKSYGLTVFGSGSLVNVSNNVDQDLNVYLSTPGAATKRSIIYSQTQGRLSLGVGGNNEYLTVINSGYVGIGTTSPDAKLTVNGAIHATEVKVTTTVPGPDYVFEKSYDLPSLDEVKSYIDENKHLPEVPSAKEMEKNGINVGEMNMLLLKKVEELTLYIIDQEKRMRLLESKQ